MSNKYQKSDLIWPDREGDLANSIYAKVKVKTPKKIKNQIILTCNPTGPNIFYKNFIDNETDK